MTAESLADLLFREPAVPVKVRLTDGDSFILAQPHRAHVTRDELIVGVAKDPFAPPEKRRLRFIPLHRVKDIKDVKLPKRSRQR
jgi:hypothetical protein